MRWTGKWQGQTTLGHDPQGKVLGILGMGGIGRVRSYHATNIATSVTDR